MTCEDCGLMNILIYDLETGRAVALVGGKDLKDGEAYIDSAGMFGRYGCLQFFGGNYSEYYVDIERDNLVVARPDSSIAINKTQVKADGVDSVILSNVPNGAKVEVAGPQELPVEDQDVIDLTVDDGYVEYSTDIAGIYHLSVDPFPYKAMRWSIVAD